MRKDTGGARGNVVARGRSIDFLGYCFTRTDMRLRKDIKRRFAAKLKSARDPQRRREVLAAYWGWCKWGKCRNLWNKITDCDMSFSDYGITGRTETKDGQKFFDVRQVKAADILNIPITVTDFICDVKTGHGPGRYAVKINCNGEEQKFITNSITLKQQLDAARKMDVLPVDTCVRRRDIGGGKCDYFFE